MNTASHLFTIPPMSRVEPRLIRGRTQPYLPANYEAWLKDMRAQMSQWWIEPPLAEVSVAYMRFAGLRRGSLNGLAGAVLDAGEGLVWAGRTKAIRSLAPIWKEAPIEQQSIYLSIHWP